MERKLRSLLDIAKEKECTEFYLEKEYQKEQSIDLLLFVYMLRHLIITKRIIIKYFYMQFFFHSFHIFKCFCFFIINKNKKNNNFSLPLANIFDRDLLLTLNFHKNKDVLSLRDFVLRTLYEACKVKLQGFQKLILIPNKISLHLHKLTQNLLTFFQWKTV